MSRNPSVRTGLPRRAATVAVVGLLVAALSGCSREEALRFGWPEGISRQAERMETLWTWSAVAALVVGVIVWGLIIWAVVRYRKRGESMPVQTRLNLPIEALYTIIPFLIVAVLFYYTAVTQTYVTREVNDPDVTVSVVAFKWNWQFVYPKETDAENTPVTTTGSTDEVPILVVPSGKRIRFVETSNDVIHSFWVPALLFKRDVIPGRTNSFEVTIDKQGSYVGRCAEYCGTYHSNMNFEMRVVSFADYQRYLTQRKAGASTAAALTAIGSQPYSTTTSPFNSDRDNRRPS